MGAVHAAPRMRSVAARGGRLIIAIGLAAGSAVAVGTPASAATTVVTAESLAGWSIVTNEAASPPYSAASANPGTSARFGFFTGPPGVPAGTGSLSMAVGTVPNSRISAVAPFPLGDPLSSITQVSYSTFGTHGGGPSDLPQPPNLKLATQTTNFGFRTLVFEPARPTQTIRPVLDAWQTWNPLTALWWFNGVPNTTPCGQSNPCPFAEMEALVGPASQVGLVYFELGDSGTGFSGVAEFLDTVTLNGSTFDFEPTAAPPPPIPDIVDDTPTIREATSMVAPGQQQVIVAHGFLPGEPVILTINSPRLTLGPEIADPSGTVTFRFTVPADFPPGTHHAVLRGTISGLTVSIGFAVTPALASTAAVPGWLIPGGVALICLGLVLVGATRLRIGRAVAGPGRLSRGGTGPDRGRAKRIA